MGCGKSTLGKELAKQLKISFIDLDQFIEKQEKTTISNLFNQKGEFHFRKIEKDALDHLLKDFEPAVIGLGGGTPCYYDNMDRLAASNHTSIYCHASIPTLAKRLMKEKDQRPMIAHISDLATMQEFIGKHLFERSLFYRKATYTMQTDDKSVAEVVNELKKML